MRKVFAVAALTMLCACSVTIPVLVVPDKGAPLRGTSTASLSGGSFEVTDGKLVCKGDYDALDRSVTITLKAECNDGRTATITATRKLTSIGGEGTILMSDGSTGKFYFGEGAGLR